MIDMKLIDPPFIYPIPTEKVKPSLPDFPLSEDVDRFVYLMQLVSDGLAKRKVSNPSKEFLDRLNFELEIIDERDYVNYFLIVADLVRAAKEDFNLFVGPGRSSAAGSLVCYCLGITDVDPIKHDLLFERFINLDRYVLPDIDIDVEEGGKDILVQYLKDKYGDDHVTHIITYAMKENRGRIEERTIVGHGIHACGVALSKLPMSAYTPLTKVDDTVVTVYDGRCIEDAGPVKFDILDFKLLEQMHRIQDRIKADADKEFDVSRIPADDQATLEVFQRGETEGIFMFESTAIKKCLSIMHSVSFSDLVALNTMYRPGLMDYIPDFIARKNGQSKIEYALPCMEKYLSETYGMLIYQEQFMLLIQNIAGFSRADSDILRKAFAKKKDGVLNEMRPRFIQGGMANGYSESVLQSLWEQWYVDARYCFNKSHAVCYTKLAYQMMYLKVHFPKEFQNVISESNF